MAAIIPLNGYRRRQPYGYAPIGVADALFYRYEQLKTQGIDSNPGPVYWPGYDWANSPWGGANANYPYGEPAPPYPGEPMPNEFFNRLIAECEKYIGITTYNNALRNSMPYSPTASTEDIYRDCSSFLHFALFTCGFKLRDPLDPAYGNAFVTGGWGTVGEQGGFFDWLGGYNAEVAERQPGDLQIVWPASKGRPYSDNNEHVMLYVGNGYVIDCTGGIKTAVQYRLKGGAGSGYRTFRIPEDYWPEV